jgi:hypothetical protein
MTLCEIPGGKIDILYTRYLYLPLLVIIPPLLGTRLAPPFCGVLTRRQIATSLVGDLALTRNLFGCGKIFLVTAYIKSVWFFFCPSSHENNGEQPKHCEIYYVFSRLLKRCPNIAVAFFKPMQLMFANLFFIIVFTRGKLKFLFWLYSFFKFFVIITCMFGTASQ